MTITTPDTAESFIEKLKAKEKAKAIVVAPQMDPKTPPRSQFFRFTCPFCNFSEKIALGKNLRQCQQCSKGL
jgi:hypothetical protein